MIFNDLVSSAQQCGDEITCYVNRAFDDLRQAQRSPLPPSVSSGLNGNRHGCTVRYAAAGITALSAILWISNDSGSLWPKIGVCADLLLFGLDFVNGSKQIQNGNGSSIQHGQTISKQHMQYKIDEILAHINRQWDDTTHVNSRQAVELIENSRTSRENKFFAKNIAFLTRKIQFSMIPYFAQIIRARTESEMNETLSNIKCALLRDIAEAVNAQIADYRAMEAKIEQ